jgi:hypothetical protein
MNDLEVRIREKQVDRLPISRGEVLLSDLSSRYPSLALDIEEEHEARQFYTALPNSLPSSLGATSVPNTPLDAKRPPSRPSTGKKAKRGNLSATNSPLLRAQNSDLIFDMDDLDVATTTVKHVVKGEDVVEEPWRDINGKPLKVQPPTFSANQKFRLFHEPVGVNGQSSEVNGGRWYEPHHTPLT